MGKDKAKDKEHHNGETTASSKTITSPEDAHLNACQSKRDLSQDCEALDATLAKTITKEVAREMAKAHAHYQVILNDRSAATIQTSLKVSSGANGFKVMDPFDWTKDKSIYQRWQLWSEKARLTLDAWKVTQKGIKSLTSITGSIERVWDTLSHGKTVKPSSASPHIKN